MTNGETQTEKICKNCFKRDASYNGVLCYTCKEEVEESIRLKQRGKDLK